MSNGIISHLQRFSTHDGCGIRSTIFLKGCNLQCKWCHNPESVSCSPQLSYHRDQCRKCYRCIPHCPSNALKKGTNHISIEFSKCTGCFSCVQYCYMNALRPCGMLWSPYETVQKLLIDRIYYKNSEGGVTFSGGEPYIQSEFLLQVLKLLKEENIHTIVQSAMMIPFTKSVLDTIPFVDYFMIDFKLWDSQQHRKWVGQENSLLLENIRHLDELGACIEVRTPLIPGVTDCVENIKSIATFVKSLRSSVSYSLVPYHPLGMSKYENFGITLEYSYWKEFDPARLKYLQNIAQNILET